MTAKYAFINDHRKCWKIGMMCRVLKVSKSGYYDWIEYIEMFYNSKRAHQSLDYRTPNEVEVDFVLQ